MYLCAQIQAHAHRHAHKHIIYYHARSRVSDRPVKSGLLTQFVSVGEVCGCTVVVSESTGICCFYTCEEENMGADETEEEREGWREWNRGRLRILRKREKSRKEEREAQITRLC